MISVVPLFPLVSRGAVTMSSHRIKRVSELVKREVSEIIQELNLTGCGFLTITAAEISADLKEGRIYLSVIGSAEQKQRALAALARQHGQIQRELAHRIVLKYTPRLKFVLDETEAQATHIEQLLNELEGEHPDD
jgi:ribosome-binding factor A